MMAVRATSELDAALSYALSSVKLSDILLKEQREAIKLVYQQRCVAVAANWIWQVRLFSGTSLFV